MAELRRWEEEKPQDKSSKLLFQTKELTSAFFMIMLYVSSEIIGAGFLVMGWTYVYSFSITAVVCVCVYEGGEC